MVSPSRYALRTPRTAPGIQMNQDRIAGGSTRPRRSCSNSRSGCNHGLPALRKTGDAGGPRRFHQLFAYRQAGGGERGLRDTGSRHGIRCWIAPRSISPGAEWGEAIIACHQQLRVMVLIFSSNTNESRQVHRREVGACSRRRRHNYADTDRASRADEIARVFHSWGSLAGRLLLPFRQHLQRLAVSIKALLARKPTLPTRPSRRNGLRCAVNEPSDRTTRDAGNNGVERSRQRCDPASR